MECLLFLDFTTFKCTLVLVRSTIRAWSKWTFHFGDNHLKGVCYMPTYFCTKTQRNKLFTEGCTLIQQSWQKSTPTKGVLSCLGSTSGAPILCTPHFSPEHTNRPVVRDGAHTEGEFLIGVLLQFFSLGESLGNHLAFFYPLGFIAALTSQPTKEEGTNGALGRTAIIPPGTSTEEDRPSQVSRWT